MIYMPTFNSIMFNINILDKYLIQTILLEINIFHSLILQTQIQDGYFCNGTKSNEIYKLRCENGK